MLRLCYRTALGLKDTSPAAKVFASISRVLKLIKTEVYKSSSSGMQGVFGRGIAGPEAIQRRIPRQVSLWH